MRHEFDEYLDAVKCIEKVNGPRSANEPKAKMISWPHDSIKRNGEWVVFVPAQNVDKSS